MSNFVIGLDFGTNSCRSLIIDIENGEELSSHVFQYPSGEAGVILNPSNPNLARQNPADYLEGIEVTTKEAIKSAKKKDKNFKAEKIIGIGVDTTGSSPMPVDADGTPLCFNDPFKENPAAMVWLWKDHSSYQEAEMISEKAAELRPQYLAKIGGTYSSEWFWSKIWHCQKTAPEVYKAAHAFVEICDWIPAILVGDTRPDHLKCSVCAAGHKAMYSQEWDGLPDEEFLETLSPGLGQLRKRLYNRAYPSEEKAGNLSVQWAEKLGLSTNVAVAVGAFDAHMGRSGCRHPNRDSG